MKALVLSICMFIAVATIAAGPPAVPAKPGGVIDLVFARSFNLTNGYEYDWSKQRPTVNTGILMVLKVDPDYVFPRNTVEPVLYVGNQPAQRLNQGYESGHVIAIIPGDVDLTKVPIWFGRPELPERLSTKAIRSERAVAEAANIRPLSAAKVRTLFSDSGGLLKANDLFSLLRDHGAELVLKFSPQEKSLAETWRLPVAKRVPQPQ